MTGAAAFLPAAPPIDWLGGGVSVSGRRWLGRPCDDRMVAAVAQAHGLPELVARLLVSRGVALDAVSLHLAPTLRDLLPDPSQLRDMDLAAARIARAIESGERIALFADYDVDGATSAALLTRFLRSVGSDPLLYVPDRIREGYGPNETAFAHLAAEGARLVITLDCGIAAHAPLKAARAMGLDVIVIDHHAAELGLPEATAVVNPNRLDESGTLGHLAAVGVAFLAIVAVNRHLRLAGRYAGAAEPDLRQWLDLVALGTVADMVPLSGVNRAFVAQGLKIMGGRRNPGLNALADTAGLSEAPAAYHLGFVFGPRVNAGGRVGKADQGARLLSTDDAREAAGLAVELDRHNQERKAIESETFAQAEREAAGRGDAPILLVAGQDWHPGVIGIVASRLVERFHRPACVVALADGVGKGSGRSVPGFDLGAAIIAARQAGLLTAGGGHKMAAGFTVAENRLSLLASFLEARLKGQGDRGEPELAIDGALTCAGATLALGETIEQLGPFGSGNPEPRFALSGARVVKAEPVGTGHVRCFVTDGVGTRLKAIAFRALETPVGQALLGASGSPVALAGRVKLDRWSGEARIQLQIEDVARV